jgi:hypothetical protein
MFGFPHYARENTGIDDKERVRESMSSSNLHIVQGGDVFCTPSMIHALIWSDGANVETTMIAQQPWRLRVAN